MAGHPPIHPHGVVRCLDQIQASEQFGSLRVAMRRMPQAASDSPSSRRIMQVGLKLYW